ncbi:MAG: hypothetical protein K0R01_149 [Mycobacterium sp.]|jgi:hypothetical protein|nr:hypothetical protein [Mycobacterium sp.]
MANKTAILSIRIIADGKQAGREFAETNKQVASFEDGLNKASIASGILVGGLALLAKSSGDAASNLEQSTGAVESVYGAHAATVKRMADDAAQNVGLAESEYLQMSAVLGSQLKNMGVPMQEVANQTGDLVALGADLSAMFGGTTADAVGALSSLLRGERDPIERYGVSINAAAVSARVASMGLGELEGAALKQAETQATLALLTEQTAAAQGQFAREANTAAGAQQRATAEWENAQAQLGEALLPLMVMLATQLGEVATWVGENTELVGIIVGVVGSFAGAVLLLNGALQTYRAVASIATAAQIAWNIAMSANPIGLIILAIGLLVGIIVFLVSNWEEVGRVAEDVLASIGRGIDGIIGWAKEALGWLGSLFGAQQEAAGLQAGALGMGGFDDADPQLPPQPPAVAVWGAWDDAAVATVLIRNDDDPATPSMDGTGGWEDWAANPATYRPEVRGGDTFQFTIQGAIDVDGTARTIKRVMREHGQRTGRDLVVVGGDDPWR